MKLIGYLSRDLEFVLIVNNQIFKKKLDKLYIETLDWIEKNKQTTDLNINVLEAKMKEVDSVYQPVVESCQNAANTVP